MFQLSRRYSRFLKDSHLLREALWKYRTRFLLGVLILLVVDVLELIPPLILARVVDRVVGSSPMDEIYNLAVIYFGVSLLQAACRMGWRYFINRSSMLAGRDLRQSIMDHILSLGTSYFDRSRVGDLLSLVTNDSEAVRMAIGPGVLTLFDALFYFLTVPFAMWVLSPRLTVIACLPLLLVPIFVFRNEKKIQTRFQAVQESFSAISAFSQETLTGVRVLKGLAAEDGRWAQFEEKGFGFIGLNMRLARVQSRFGPGLDFLMSLALVLLLYVGGGEVIGGAVSVGTFVAFQRYIQKMVWPMTAVGLAVTYFQRSFASTHRIDDEFAEVTDIPERLTPRSTEPRGAIAFHQLDFRFSLESEPVLHGINLSILPGEKIAFSGRVGSGKSALLSLLPRLYPVADGRIQLDGIDLNDWRLEDLRNAIAYVSQDLFLFNATLLENLRVAEGDPRRACRFTREQVEEACRLAQIHDEILQFDQGYDTPVGERGVTVSGGQKQRLTLARALLVQPSVLILDDALSAVDVQTERRILDGISKLPHPPTILMAAHRIQTLQAFDRIVYLEAGRIKKIIRGSEVATLETLG